MLLMLQTKRQREVGMWRYREEKGMGEDMTSFLWTPAVRLTLWYWTMDETEEAP